VPSAGSDLFEVIGYKKTGSLSIPEEIVMRNIDETDVTKCRVLVIDREISQNLGASYTLVKKLSVVRYDVQMMPSGCYKLRINMLQNSADTNATLKNDMYVYVAKSTTNNLGRYLLHNIDGEKTETEQFIPFFTLQYEANEMDVPPYCMRKK
jgi:hypothetical protein